MIKKLIFTKTNKTLCNIGTRTELKDNLNQTLYTGDFMKFDDNITSFIIKEKDDLEMFGITQKKIDENSGTKIKSFTELKNGELYGWIKVVFYKEKWFGEQCKFQCCQFEDDEDKSQPDLVCCNNENNKEDVEGNCNIKLCPMRK